MRKKLISILLITILCISILPTNISFAKKEVELITLGTGKYKITVKNTTTISEITKILGTPKLVTKSAFGGNAYTFYTDNNYSNYLYIETAENGGIVSYGTVEPGYKAEEVSYGDTFDFKSLYGILNGYTVYNDDDLSILGGVYYNTQDFRYGAIVNKYKENYLANEDEYSKGLSKQAILMFNALSTKLGKKCNLQFNEEYYYINKQFMEFGTSINRYCYQMDYTSKMKNLYVVDIKITSQAYFLNPMALAEAAVNEYSRDLEGNNIPVFYYDVKNEEARSIVLNDETLKQEYKELMELTESEQNKLKEGRAEYEKSNKYFLQDSKVDYEIQPQETQAETLIAGKLKQSKKDGMIAYLNAIRAAGGLPRFSWNNEAESYAQHKAVLLSYMNRQLGINFSHSPQRPTGVNISDTFWKEATKGHYAENLSQISFGTYASVWDGFKSSIKGQLDESNNVSGPTSTGHRVELINPQNSKVAIGAAKSVVSVEFGTKKQNDYMITAWPSEGITFLETLEKRNFKWTVQFFKKYTVTKNTKVKVTDLYTGKQWNFSNDSQLDNQIYKIWGEDSINMFKNQILWGSSDLSIKEGDIFKVEVSNLTDKETGTSNNTYTYRTVFKYADIKEEDRTKPISTIKINLPDTISKEKDGTITILNNEKTKLSAQIDEQAKNTYVRWESSNPSAISVTQNGTLEVKKVTTVPVTITVYSAKDNKIKDTVKVKCQTLLKGDVNKDGKIKLYDALQILKQSILNNKIDEETKWIMDWNSDGKIKLYDALQVLRKAILG